jgi:hypothetical protein
MGIARTGESRSWVLARDELRTRIATKARNMLRIYGVRLA